MFVTNACSHIDCIQVALDGSELCPNHHPDLSGYNPSLKDSLLKASGIIENRNWSGIDFSNMDDAAERSWNPQLQEVPMRGDV